MTSSKPNLLIAEDNEINRRVIGAMLSDCGYELHFAFDGVQAVELFRTLQPDLILMDVSMPRMTGLEATREIRKLEPAGKHTRVVGVTAHAMENDRTACLESGMDDYLTKPINRQVLFTAMRIPVPAPSG